MKIFFLALALLSVSIAWGSPRESAERYVNLLLSGEFHKSAEMYHSEALENIRNAIFPIIELEIENDVKDGMAEGGFPGESLESIRSLSVHEFSSKFLIYILKLTEERIKYTEVEILDGEVREQETVHIIMRASTKGLKKNWLSTKLVVASFKQDGKVWKLLSPAEIQGLVNFYRAKYSLKQE